VNIHSRGRGALLLYLFTDITEDDAPTRVRVGSHLDVARFLAPAGEAGVAGPDTGPVDAVSAERPVVEATGEAGDVFICHPFLVHAAQLHRGTTPRLIAQPGAGLLEPFALQGNARPAPVEEAILMALNAG
jgi:ectoine hydroxylase-related dioxygenase (phytanoyl-CoA dioxygenase family)